jgi:phosphoglycerate kinase
MQPGDILVLENLRFEPGEKAGDEAFGRALAQLGDYYVNDAFGTAHRADASIAVVPRFLPAYAGRLMARELQVLGGLLAAPKRPYWAIVGGAKVSDKVGLLGRLLDQVDGLVIGGGMANTFLTAQGFRLGLSKVEAEAVATARTLLDQAHARQVRILLPDDLVLATAFSADAPHRVAAPDQVRADEMALDIGPHSVQTILQALQSAQTVFWNGPMGVFEWDAFSHGTLDLARGLASLSATVVVGGGDSVAAVSKAGVSDRLSHISTGGGATLQLLEGKVLPGVQALVDSAQRGA